MVATVAVSYWMIGAYIGFVSVSTLLVGLLPPLVNLPPCKDDDTRIGTESEPAINIVENFAPDQEIQDQEVFEEIHLRGKRSTQQIDLLELFARSEKNIKDAMEEDPLLSRRYKPKAALSICPELLTPAPNVEYPWFDPRLPSYISPVNYNLELMFSNVNFELYNGYLVITFDITESANTFLFHNSGNDVPLLQFFQDDTNAEIDINCVGAYLEQKRDYFVVRTTNFLQPNEGPFKIAFLFLDFYTGIPDGIFKTQYGRPEDNASIILSKFQPISAREAFPCFDEPGFKTTFDVTIYHRDDFQAVFNTRQISSVPDTFPNVMVTKFETTPKLPTYFTAFAVFNKRDFKPVIRMTNSSIPITLWARTQFVDGGFVDDAADLCLDIFEAVSDIFRNVNPISFPKKIDILTVPEYEVDAVAHYGFPIFEEDKLLFKWTTASERDKQNIGLLVAKVFAEFWFGNFITPEFWDELWVQEGFADFIKYKAVEEAFPEWNIPDQFISEELVVSLMLDGFPSSHPIAKNITTPYEIEEFFDVIESSKTAAILRMVEKEMTVTQLYAAFTAFLNFSPFGIADITEFYKALPPIGDKNWDPEDFFDHWTKQSNYPLVIVELVGTAPPQSVRFRQFRGVNTNYTLFGDSNIYPSPYDWTWYVPIDCSFGTGPQPTDPVREDEFYLDKKDDTFALPPSQTWTWIHCDRQFVGYMELDYTRDNWKLLGDGLKARNPEFTAEDRAQILHNLFLNSFTERGDYFQLRDVLDYLPTEQDFLPWRIVNLHVSRMDTVLQYRKTFGPLSGYFDNVLRLFEATMDVWVPGGSHIEELLRENIINLACRLQDSVCLNKATELWDQLVPYLMNGDFENAPVPAYARQVVYDYHVQNTYNLDDWDLIFRDYEVILDENEHRKLLSSLTFTRLPWLLAGIVTGIGNEFVRKIDFFTIMKYLVRNPVGREIAWDYYRINFAKLQETYGDDDPRLGVLLLYITESFETEFLLYELLDFEFDTPSGAAESARLKALEITSTNINWLMDKEEEIAAAFGSPRGGKKPQGSSPNLNPLLNPYTHRNREDFLRRAREAVEKAVRQGKSNSVESFIKSKTL